MNAASVPLWAALPAALLLVCGGLITLIGALGLLRFDAFYARLHAPTMGTTLGAGCVLLASILVFSALAQRPVLHEVLITVCLLITSPITTMLLMRAALLRRQG
ncbi:MAG: cation:proton antiporter [Candidatus Competibacteraceae bacterium]|nr:cation:proton antiporter [Candidatus Competibacteraceae bacterium]